MRTIFAAAICAAVAFPALAEEGFSEGSKEIFKQVIAGKGYKCQDIKTIVPKGSEARGDVVQVGCLVEGAGWTNRLYYRVTLAPNDDVFVEPVE